MSDTELIFACFLNWTMFGIDAMLPDFYTHKKVVKIPIYIPFENQLNKWVILYSIVEQISCRIDLI